MIRILNHSTLVRLFVFFLKILSMSQTLFYHYLGGSGKGGGGVRGNGRPKDRPSSGGKRSTPPRQPNVQLSKVVSSIRSRHINN
jgi:hypothetical protein